MPDPFAVDTFLKRAGGSIAKFNGKALAEIKLSMFADRRKMVMLWLKFLKGIKEAGFDPSEAKSLVETFLMFEDRPTMVAGGTLEVGGRIDNVRETEMGIDIAVEFAAPAMPFLGGMSAGLDAGFSYRRLDREQTSQNYRSGIRYSIASGEFKEEGFVKAAQMVLEKPDIEIPDLKPEEVNDSSDLLSSKVLPFITGIFGTTSP